ncbi:MAG: hypothetical protein HYY37_00490 [Candidatus Aenigmarchaeota archaeon]|nr:hypothetical protein [Candidatus Aenigmarchaeota archaeon]
MEVKDPRATAQRLLFRAYASLRDGNVAAAERAYRHALWLDPGLGLIGEMPPYRVRAGSGTTADTRRSMQNAPRQANEPDQRYYWTKAWQADEAEADRELAEGRVISFPTLGEALRYLTSNASQS